MSTRTLTDEHRAALEAAAIDPNSALEYGVYSALRYEDLPEGFGEYVPTPALVFPWHSPSGVLEYQVRPDHPRLSKDGDEIKYEFRRGIAPGLCRVRDPRGRRVFIIEGTKQSLAAARYLLPDDAVYGLAGAWNWSQDKVPTADLGIAHGRRVYICLDADAATNPDVYAGGRRLAAALAARGADEIRFIRVPAGGKIGLDDYLATIPEAERQGVMLRLVELSAGNRKPADKQPAPKRKGPEDDAFFDEAGSFRAETFARAVLLRSPGLVTHDRRVLLYKNGVYQFSDLQFEAVVLDLLEDKFNPYRVDVARLTVATILRQEGRVALDHLSEPLLNCRNGLLDLRTLELKEHTPEVWSTNQIPVEWDPQAGCPFYLEWTSRQVPTGRLEDLEEVSSTCLDPTRTPRKALALFGVPRTGKSTWIRLLEAMVGPDNASGVDLTKLDARFQVADLYNMMLNASSDIPAAFLTDLSVFKKLTGEDTIPAERKHAHPFRFTNRALLAFSANEPPQMHASAFSAYESRVKPFKFDRSFRGNEDMTVDARLHAELPGILVRWVKAWQRFHARGERYQETPLGDWDSQPALRWLATRCVIHSVLKGSLVDEEQGSTPKALLSAYNAWAQSAAEDGMTKTQDLSAVLQTNPNVHEIRLRPKKNRGLNVTVKDTDGDEDEPEWQTVADEWQMDPFQLPPINISSTSTYTSNRSSGGSGGSTLEKKSKGENVSLGEREIPGLEKYETTATTATTATDHTLYVDLETTAYPPEHPLGRIRTVQIAIDDGPVEVFVVEPRPNGTPEQYQDWQTAWQYVKELLNSGATLVFHNAPGQDVRYLVHEGLLDEPVPWHRIRDTMFEAKIKVPSQERGHYKLERLEEDLLGSTRADEATAKRKKRFARGKWLTNTEIDTAPERNGWLQVPLDDPDFLEYARTDVTVMRDLAEYLETADPGEPAWEPPPTTIRQDRYSGSILALLDRERRLADLCLGMTRRGVLVDRDLAQDLDRKYQLEIASLEGVIRDLGVENPASTQQIAAVLEAAGIKVPLTRKGNPNLDEKALAGIDHPLVDLIRRYRRASKDRSSYTQAALKFSAFDGRVHAQINTAEASTWRMSITDPAMQTIPKYGSRLREMYVADPGHVLLSADLASVELRVGAAVSEDENLIQKFLSGESLWDEIRERVFPGAGKESKEHTRTKNVGYGSLFGAGAERLSEYTGSVELAAQIRREFWRAYPGLRALFNILMELSDEQREDGGKVILNSYGRSLWIPAAAPYKGLNYLIQSTARDLLVDAMFAIEDAGFGDYLWLPVHDELLLQVPENRVAEATEVLCTAMTATLGTVPITCEVSNPSERWSAK